MARALRRCMRASTFVLTGLLLLGCGGRAVLLDDTPVPSASDAGADTGHPHPAPGPTPTPTPHPPPPPPPPRSVTDGADVVRLYYAILGAPTGPNDTCERDAHDYAI